MLKNGTFNGSQKTKKLEDKKLESVKNSIFADPRIDKNPDLTQKTIFSKQVTVTKPPGVIRLPPVRNAPSAVQVKKYQRIVHESHGGSLTLEGRATMLANTHISSYGTSGGPK